MSIFGDHKDLDSVLILFLDIDDLRNLYRVNKYYHDLVIPLLQEYITAFANSSATRSFIEALRTNNINIVKYYFTNFASDISDKYCWDYIALMRADINAHILDYIVLVRTLPRFDSNRFVSEISDRACWMYNLLKIACSFGLMNKFKWALKKIEQYEFFLTYYTKLFNLACQNGHLDIAQLLLKEKHKEIDIFYGREYRFKRVCKNSHIKVAEWLLSIDKSIDIRYNDDEIFKSLFKTGNLSMINFLCSLVREYNYYTTYVPKYNYIIEKN